MNIFTRKVEASEPEKKEETVECSDCQAIIRKINSVQYRDPEHIFGDRTVYYCGRCRKPYDEVVIVSKEYLGGIWRYGQKTDIKPTYRGHTLTKETTYFKTEHIEVDINGNHMACKKGGKKKK